MDPWTAWFNHTMSCADCDQHGQCDDGKAMMRAVDPDLVSALDAITGEFTVQLINV